MVRARSKGSSGERQAAELLMQWARLGGHRIKVERNLEQSRAGGADLLGVPAMTIEVKRCETLSIPAWWRQVLAATPPGSTPLLMYRQNRSPWMFQTKLWVTVGGQHFVLKARLEEAEAKTWFLQHLDHHKETT